MDPSAAPLDPDVVHPDPVVQLARWFEEAVDAGVRQPEAVTLASIGLDGAPDARTVLMRGFDERGVAFYTNLDSAKARQLRAQPYGSLVFHWREIERQVRVRGPVTRLSVEEATRYWQSRPRGHRIGAWSSPQSEVTDAATLAARVRDVEARFAGDDPPLPPFWGGYVVGIDELELWQGRTDRLHDRVRYRHVDATWLRERLAP